MKYLIHITSCSLLAALFLLGSCKKGDVGATGATGATGDSGATGATGTANVLYSAWQDVTFTAATSSGSTYYYVDITADSLTTAIATNGDVRVYINIGTSDDPAIVSFESLGIVIAGTGIIELQSSSDYSGYPVRYVLIPGGVSVNAKTASIDWSNYKEVQKYLGITN